MVTTGAIRCAKLQSNCHHQQTNTQLSYRPDALGIILRALHVDCNGSEVIGLSHSRCTFMQQLVVHAYVMYLCHLAV